MPAMRWTGEMSQITRRSFLKVSTQALLAASGMLGLGALLRYLGYQASPPPITQLDLGPASAYPPGSRTLLPDVPALLVHTEVGFSAISLVCTHLGCTVEPTPQGFACPCHGSEFDPGGLPRRGPAEKPLPSLQVEQDAEGRLILHVV